MDDELIMEKDLLKKIAELDLSELGLVSRTELEFSFKQGNIKRVVIHTVDGEQFLLLFYFGEDKPLLTYATSEPHRPCYFKRIPTILKTLGHVNTGTMQILFYVKQLPTNK